MAVVTISRLIGSGGDEIALKVAQGLGYDFVDNALIVKISERAGVSVEDIAGFDERYQSRTVEWIKNFMGPRMDKILRDEGKRLDPESFFEYSKTVIRGLAETGNVVIVGRAGQFILKDMDTAFHVRIVANKGFRVERVKANRDISEEDALEIVKKSDNMRKHYTERHFKSDWEHPLAYHLILDSSKLGIEETASIIVDSIIRFSKTHEYIPGLRDRRRIHDRRKEKQRKGDRRTSGVGWTTKDLHAAILREGRAPRSFSKPDRRKKDRRRTTRR